MQHETIEVASFKWQEITLHHHKPINDWDLQFIFPQSVHKCKIMLSDDDFPKDSKFSRPCDSCRNKIWLKILNIDALKIQFVTYCSTGRKGYQSYYKVIDP